MIFGLSYRLPVQSGEFSKLSPEEQKKVCEKDATLKLAQLLLETFPFQQKAIFGYGNPPDHREWNIEFAAFERESLNTFLIKLNRELVDYPNLKEKISLIVREFVDENYNKHESNSTENKQG